MAAIDVVNRVLREFKRYTGDGLPNEPVGAPLPVGDPQSGVQNPKKSELREALLAPLQDIDDEVERAAAEADRAEDAADRAASYIPTGVAKAITGLVPFNSPLNPATHIGVAPGTARDKDNAFDIALVTGMEKRIDQVWEAGNGNGGRDVAGAFAANTGVHIFLIRNPTTAEVDLLLSQSATSPVMPSGFTQRRRINCLMLDESAEPNAGIWYANGDFYFKEPFVLVSGVPANTTALTTLSVPAGVKMRALCNVIADDSAGGNPAFGIVFSDPDLGPPVTNLGLLSFWKMAGGTDVGRVLSWTDTASRVYAGGFYGSATSTLSLISVGWTDLRDEFA